MDDGAALGRNNSFSTSRTDDVQPHRLMASLPPLPSVSVAYSPGQRYCSLAAYPQRQSGFTEGQGESGVRAGACRGESLSRQTALVGAQGWQRAGLSPHSKLKGLWCRFGAGPNKYIICLADLLVSNDSCLILLRIKFRYFARIL